MGRNVVRQVIRGEFLREPSPRCERRNTGTGAMPTARFAEFTADQVLGALVPRSVRISEAPSHGETVMTYDPGSPGAMAYLEAAREITQRAVR